MIFNKNKKTFGKLGEKIPINYERRTVPQKESMQERVRSNILYICNIYTQTAGKSEYKKINFQHNKKN